MKKFVVDQKFLFVVLLISLSLFLGSQLFLQTSFLSGDYRAQHVPWAVSLDRAVKSGTLPLWDPYTHSGFPMLAEGQMAALYPPTLLFYLLFPVRIAYAWSNVLHYILAIIWMYIFLRNAGLKDFSSAMGALIFAFGSASGGGYYNTISLKVLCWFPLTLFITDCYFKKRRLPYMFLLGGIFAWQVLAGYFQYAVYSIFFSGVYFYYSSIIANSNHAYRPFRNLKDSKDFSPGNSTNSSGQAGNVVKGLCKDTIAFIAAGITALVIASPQIYETLKLISFCLRKGTDLNFALWGSFWPAGIATLFFPRIGGMPFVNGAIFAGIVPLSTAFFIRKKDFNKQLVFLFILFFVSLVFALGKYSPLYKFILNAVNFYGFRVPAKFLFFTGFALSGICAFGVKAFMDINLDKKRARRAFVIWWSVIALGVALIVAANIAVHFKDYWMDVAEKYVMTDVYGQAHHKDSLEGYLSRRESIYYQAREIISFKNINIILMAVCTLIAALFLYVRKRNLLGLSLVRWAFLGVVCVELLIYNHYFPGMKMRSNLKPLDTFIKESPVADYINEDRELFRVYYFLDRSPAGIDESFQIWPNRSVNYKIFDVGCYTPLVMGNYYNFMGGLGSVDDSMGAVWSNIDTLEREKAILDFLNVKYVLSAAEIPFLSKVKETCLPVGKVGKIKIYKNKSFYPRCFLTDKIEFMPEAEIRGKIVSSPPTGKYPEVFLSENFKPVDKQNNELKWLKVGASSYSEIEEYSPNKLKIKTINNAGKALLVLSELYYPGWKAVVNSVPAEIFRVNSLFRGVIVGPGENEIIMKYSPSWFFYLLAASIVGYCTVILLFLAFKFGWEKAFVYFSVVFAIIVFLFYLNVFIYSQVAGKV